MEQPNIPLSNFGATQQEREERLRACLARETMLNQQIVDYYNEMGWNHGSNDVTRPLPSDMTIAMFEDRLRENGSMV